MASYFRVLTRPLGYLDRPGSSPTDVGGTHTSRRCVGQVRLFDTPLRKSTPNCQVAQYNVYASNVGAEHTLKPCSRKAITVSKPTTQ